MVYIDGIIFSIQKSGGISTLFCELLKRFKTKVYLFCYSNSNDVFIEFSNSFSKEVVLDLHESKFTFLTRFFDIRVPSNVKIFHSTYYRLPVFWQRKNLKIVTTVHDFTAEKNIRGFRSYIHYWQKKRAIENSDFIICISENTKKDMNEIIPKSRFIKTEVVYNGVSEIFKDDIKYHVLPEFSNYVLFVGSRTSYKKFQETVIALSYHDSLHLKIIGGGNLNKEELNILCRYLPSRFSFENYVSTNTLANYYRKAYCLCYPSIYEGFGIPIVEAMGVGCPVIASNCSSIPEVASDAAILLDVPDPTNIFQALKKLEDFNIRKEKICKGYIQSSKFSWLQTSINVENIYQSLLRQ